MAGSFRRLDGRTRRRALCVVLALLGGLVAVVAPPLSTAGAVGGDWVGSSTNSDTFTVVSNGSGVDAPQFEYYVNYGYEGGEGSGAPLTSWTFTDSSASGGNITVPWQFDGFHAFFNVTARLEAIVGDGDGGFEVRNELVDGYSPGCFPADQGGCNAPSAGFSYSGTYTFTNVPPGREYGFRISGSNGDSNSVLSGRLTLSAAPFVAQTATLDDNTSWSRALPLSGTVNGTIVQPGESRWYKFPVTPDSDVAVTLAGLAQNYDLAIYRDIAKVFDQLTTPGDLNTLGAQFAADAYAPSIYSPSIYSPSIYSPSIYSPSIYSPSIYSPSIYSPSIYSPSIYSPSIYSPSIYSPSIYSPSIYSPSIYSPSIYSPGSPVSPADQAFLDAFTSAQTRSLIAVSANEGISPETIRTATWNNTGDFYVRVSGRNGASSPTPFSLSLDRADGPCASIPIDTYPTAPTITGLAAGKQTIVLTDTSRLAGADAAYSAKLQQLATATNGVVVDVAASQRVQRLHAQADANPDCAYLMNLTASAIRDVVVAYRQSNPGLQYVVLAGGDSVIPFFRYADGAGIGPESEYVPPLRDGTTANAALRSNSVLGQDAYGTNVQLQLQGTELPVPDLPVGRLVETPAQISTMIDAYLTSPVMRPGSSLVTGYDFLTSAADAVNEDFAAGVGATNADTLITNQGVDTKVTTTGNTPKRTESWTATDLRRALTAKRHDLYFIAGHFSANSTLAADYQTSVATPEFANTNLFANSLVVSPGCHSGFNIQDGDGIPTLTEPLDWPQLLASQGATLVAGTGYQYADTDFLAYSAKIYTIFSENLRYGSVGTAVPVGVALADAKRTYLEQTPSLSGIDRKSVIQATLYGLPMMGVDLQAGRLSKPVPAGGLTVTNVATGTPGSTLGLRTASYTVVPTVSTVQTKPVLDLNGNPTGQQFRWREGRDGVQTGPALPALPKQIDDVTSSTGEVLRGVGFRSGTYTDTPGVTPLTGAPATEQNGVHTDFVSPQFWPQRLATVNYYGQIAGSASDGRTRLVTTPAQYRTDGPGTNTERSYTSLGYQLFYSNSYEKIGDKTPALAAPPSISQVVGLDNGAGGVAVQAVVTGDPSAGIQQVWVTYTAESGPLYGSWQSIDLTQSRADSSQWNGTIPLPPGQDPSKVRFIIQAVNGVGLVGIDNNLGAGYTPGVLVGATPATLLPTSISLPANAPTAAPASSSVPVSATLGNAPTGSRVTFSIGGASATGTTDANGVATATVRLTSTVGATSLTASYAGDDTHAPSSISQPFTVLRGATSLVLASSGATKVTGAVFSGVTATLTRTDTTTPLTQQAVEFTVSTATGAVVRRTVATDSNGVASLGEIKVPNGSYTVSARFAGTSTGFAPVDAAPITLTVAVGGPNVVAVADPAPNAAGWNTTDVAVRFTCDDLTGIASCPATVNVTTDGVTTVSGTATDGLGNTNRGELVVRRDTVAPTLAGAPTTAANANGWYRGDVTVAWTCSDGGSGLAVACPSPSTITGEGTGLTAGQSISDVAGNSTSALSAPAVQIDRTAPETSAGSVPATSTAPVTITLVPSDALSGVATTQYRVDTGAITTGTSVVVSSVGPHTVQFWSTDRAGNVEATKTVSFTISGSTAAPSISWTSSPAPNRNGWNNTNVTVTFTCTARPGTAIRSCTPPVQVTSEGRAQAVVGTAVTTAGVSTSTTARVSIDKTAPTVTARYSGQPNAAGWYRAPVVVQFVCADALSGVTKCTNATLVRGDGVVSVPGSATDAAGNVTSATFGPLKIDRTPPVVRITGLTAGLYDFGTRPTPACATTDALSGVATAATLKVVNKGPVVTVTCSGAVDVAGNPAPTVTATYRVGNICNGFTRIVRGYVLGSSSPTRFTVADALALLLAQGRTERFVTQVRAQVGITLTRAQADELVSLVPYLEDH